MKTNMKTIRQWMDGLPEPIKELAIQYAMERNKKHDEQRGEILIDIVQKDSLGEALYSAFTFSDTKEGFDYWKRIAVEYEFKK